MGFPEGECRPPPLTTLPGIPTTVACAGTEPAVTADRDGAEHSRACADQHPVLDRRVAFALLDAGSSQGHPLIQGHIVANLRRLTDDHAHTVVNEQAPADARTRMDLDASPEAGPVADNTRQRR